MNTSESILKFGKAFNDRLDENLVIFSMNYVKHGENSLALDTLFEYLYEHDVKITFTEFDEAILLAKQLKLDEASLAYLKKLVVHT